MFHVICLVHLRDNLAGRGEFSVGGPGLGFAVTWSWGLRES